MREDKQDKYTKGDLVAAMMDFFAAGTETSSTTLKWALLFLAINPVSRPFLLSKSNDYFLQCKIKGIFT